MEIIKMDEGEIMVTINKAICALGRFITERKPKAIIGLDPGVNTGFALSINGKLQEVATLTHIRGMR